MELLVKAWPENTNQLASRGQWNRFFLTDKINRDIPKDSRLDETEDRIIAAIDGLYVSLGIER